MQNTVCFCSLAIKGKYLVPRVLQSNNKQGSKNKECWNLKAKLICLFMCMKSHELGTFGVSLG